MFPSSLHNPSKKKQLQLGHFVFLVFLNMAASDFNTLRAALSSLPEHLSEIRSHDVVRTPLQLLLGDLLGEGEAGQLALHPWLFHQQ
jgi:hypothetical protein